MYSNKIENYLIRDKFARKIYCGVIAIDQIPMVKVKRPCAFIVNNQESDRPGEHWVAIYIPRYRHPEYFDSYGMPPFDTRIKRFLKINGPNFIYNDKPIQGNDSVNCGKFCIFYLYFKSRNFPLSKIKKFFSNNFENNDFIVNKFFNRL